MLENRKQVKEWLRFPAGAGIVIDSSPKAEYYESLKKAEALWRALSLSQAEYSKV